MKRFILRMLAIIASPLYLPLAWIKASRLGRKKKKLGEEYDSERAYKFILRVAKFVRLVKNVHIEVQNLEKFSTTPGLVISNHQSNADGLIILLALLENEKLSKINAFIAKSELENDKLFGPFLKAINTHFIDRGNVRQIVEIFTEAKKEITDHKINLIIFPEGTRNKSRNIGDFNPGSFKLAVQTYAPVKPLVIIDSYRLFLKGKEKTKNVKVVFLDEIPADRVMTMDTIGLSKYLRTEMKNIIENNSEEILKDLNQTNNQ